MNQVEVHPVFAQRALQAVNSRSGTLTQAWAPLAHSQVLDDPTVNEVARRRGRTAAQVVLRWHLQQGRTVIPKSVRSERIVENAALFDFALAADDIALIDTLDRDQRLGPDPNQLH